MQFSTLESVADIQYLDKLQSDHSKIQSLSSPTMNFYTINSVKRHTYKIRLISCLLDIYIHNMKKSKPGTLQVAVVQNLVINRFEGEHQISKIHWQFNQNNTNRYATKCDW